MNRTFILSLFLMITASGLRAQVTSFSIDSSLFKKELLPSLDVIYKDDQSYRYTVTELYKNKADKKQTDSVWKIIREKDSLNLIQVERILNQYGWLGPQDVGMNGSQALFLVIQHADLATQQKYLPMIRKAEKEGKILSSNLAILEDRIAMREGKKQPYGSQIIADRETGEQYVYPVEDPDNLDKRRSAMGLQPMKKYFPQWDLEAYKKKLPEIVEKARKRNIH